MNVNVYIDRLIMDGIPVNQLDRSLLQEAVQTELARLITNHGMSYEQSVDLAVAQSPLTINATHNSIDMGQQVAYAVYRGIE